MKKYLLIIGGAILLLIVLFFLQSFIRNSLGFLTNTASVKFNDETVKLEVADDAKEREIGLSSKKSLADNQGMLFIFEEPGTYPFWMKGMDFPIDIIFLNDKKIVTIYENVPAPKNSTQDLQIYPPKEPADRVIELNAGKAKEYGLKEGQALEISL